MCRRFVNGGHQVVTLVRPGADRSGLPESAITFAEGDITRPDTLPAAFEGCDCVVHLVGIIRESGEATFEKIHDTGTRNVVEAAEQAGVAQIVHMSAAGTRSDGESDYHRTKWAAEQTVKGSSMRWTIMRPSLIFGKGDGFTNTLIDLIRKSPVIPIVGRGENLMQPVAVEDVVTCFQRVVENEGHHGQCYLLGGPDRIPFKRIVSLVARQMGTRKPTVHIPVPIVRPVAGAMSNLLAGFPLTPDQLRMLLEDNIAQPNDAEEVFDLKLTSFQDGLKKILAA